MELSEKQNQQLTHILEWKYSVMVEQLTLIHGWTSDVIYTGNRFMVYAMWLEVEMSVHIAWGFKKQNTAVMIGRSIFNKGGTVDIGELCLSYGGGGHANAGTCQLDNDLVDQELPNIIEKLNQHPERHEY